MVLVRHMVGVGRRMWLYQSRRMGIWVRVILLRGFTGRVEDSLVSHVKAQGPKASVYRGLDWGLDRE